jgi:hypothetical protein
MILLQCKGVLNCAVVSLQVFVRPTAPMLRGFPEAKSCRNLTIVVVAAVAVPISPQKEPPIDASLLELSLAANDTRVRGPGPARKTFVGESVDGPASSAADFKPRVGAERSGQSRTSTKAYRKCNSHTILSVALQS